MSDEEEQLSAEEVERRAAKAAAKSKASGDDAPVVPPAQRPALAEGLVQGDSDDDVPVGDSAPSGAHSIPASDPGAGASGGSGSLQDRVDQLKEVIDSLKASLHAERQSAADKDVQIHKLLAERDFVVDEYRRSFQKDADELKAQLKKEQEVNREMETQLQEVLGLWESAAGDARSEAAAEVTDLRKQLDAAHARIGDAEDARRAQETKLRAEMDQIMKLWEEAQHTNAAEVEHLQERILELKQQLADTKARLRKAEGHLEDYNF